MKKGKERIIALICIIVMVLSIIPLDFTKKVMASDLVDIKVILDNYTKNQDVLFTIINQSTGARTTTKKEKACNKEEISLTSINVDQKYTIEIDATNSIKKVIRNISFNKSDYLVNMEEFIFNGIVSDNNNKPLEGAEIKFFNDDSTEVTNITSDQNGKYSVSLFADSTYSANITSEGKIDKNIGDISKDTGEVRTCLDSKKYKISYPQNIENGIININPYSESYEYNSIISVKAVANDGYYINSLTIKPENDTEYYVDTKQNTPEITYELPPIKQNYTVNATFEKKKYEINYDVNEGGKVLSIYNGETEILQKDIVEHGSNYGFKVVPDEHYHIKDVYVDGEKQFLRSDKEYEYTFPNPIINNSNIKVEFEIDQCAIDLNIGDNGSIQYDGILYTKYSRNKRIYVDYNKSPEFIIKPNDNFNLENLKVINCEKHVEEDNTLSFVGNEKHYILKNVQTNYTIDVQFSQCKNINESELSVESSNNYCKIFTDGNNINYVTKNRDNPQLTIKPKNPQFIGFNYKNNSWEFPKFQPLGYTTTDTTYYSNLWLVDGLTGKQFRIDFNSIGLIIDKKPPKVNTFEKYDKFYKSGQVIKGTIEDDGNSGICEVHYSTNKDLANKDTYETTSEDTLLTKDENWQFTVNKDKSGIYTYYVWAYDNAWNSSTYPSGPKKIDVKIDAEAPVISTDYKDPSDAVSLDKAIKIPVKLTDEKLGSGPKEIRYTTSPDESLFKNDSIDKSNDKVKTAKIDSNGNAIIVADKDDTVDTQYYIWGYDKAGNKTKTHLSCRVIFDNDRPNILIDRNNDESAWTNDKVTVTGTVTDEGGSLSTYVRYSKSKEAFQNKYDKSDDSDHSYDAVRQVNVTDGKFSIPFEEAYDGDYYFWAVDSAGNPSDNLEKDAKVQIHIDKSNPIITEYNFPDKEDLNNYKAGLFDNKPIIVEVKATDQEKEDIPTSGLKNIKLHTIDGTTKKDTLLESKTFDAENGVATFELPVGFYGTIYASAEDNVTNPSSVKTDRATYPTEFNINKDGLIMIENKAPGISNTINGANGFQNYYYSDNPVINIDFNDKIESINSGLRNIEIKVKDPDGRTITKTAEEFLDETIQEQKSYSIKTSEVSQRDGEYVVTATSVDNAGNESEPKIVKVSKDSTAPVITNFEFISNGYKEVNEQSTYTPQVKPYGYYFNQDVQAVITAEDSFQGASGVSAINYYLVNENGQAGEVHTVKVDANNQIRVTIPKDFKGQIFANAIDHVKNTSQYVTPSSLIIESPEKHQNEGHVHFDINPSQNKDALGYDLYSGDTAVSVTATDQYSGIRRIEWWVTSPYDTANNQSGVIEVNNDKTFVNGIDSGWAQTKTDVNLVTEMKKTLVISNNSNNIITKVRVTDRAGNVSEQEIHFDIDKSLPEFNVTYDNNTPDTQYSNIYKDSRTATIVVKERNFDESRVVSSITNTDGPVPVFSNWTHIADEQNPDQNIHIATVTYEQDGDYEFAISMSDAAGNVSATSINEAFTIDRTIPVVNVNYDNNNVQNGNYFNSARKATITIVEHNFDPARVNITGTATDDGQQISFPGLSDWNSNGDEHTSVINYSTDGSYAFDIAFTDMASNNAEALPHEEFVVDTTMPELQIAGVQDRSANKGSVIPVVTFTDVNFDENGTAITLNGSNRGKVDVNGTFADTTHGKVFTFNDFEQIKDVDDIYTLTAKIRDRAGNETTQSIVFSVNRFGSVYTIDQKTKEIEGKYVKSTGDIVLYETNVDSIDLNQLKVKIIKNGNPIDLTSNKDYMVEKNGGDGQWSQYKYTISKNLFVEDGKYSIILYSVDAAGNINENNENTKKAEITFGVDNTKPVIIPADLKNNKQYAVNKKKVSVTVKDNLVLDHVKIMLNGKEVKCQIEGDNYSFAIPESDQKQKVSIAAVDAAGNELKVNVKNVLVSTNVFVRWYNNTPLFIGTIITGCLVIAGITLLIVVRLRKKNK